jgi:serine/threonine-protein kinase
MIAVLPFRNIGDDPENQIFIDGLIEILSSKLSQLEQFQQGYLVVPASETASAGIKTASAARDAFGVNLVVTGSVQPMDRGVRVIINLIDAVTLRQLESRIIDDTFVETSVLQDDAVFSLAGMLDIGIEPEARMMLTAGGTAVPGAYEYYLRGIGHLQRFDRIEEINAAIRLFNRALEEDPDFALAHAGLGDANLYLYRRTKNTEWIEPAEQSIRRAIEIDRTLSPVHTSLGSLLIEKGEYEMALDAHSTALELNPTNFEAYRGRARAFKSLQRLSEAEETYKKAIEMKPDYWAGYAELGVFYSQYGRFDEAAEQFVIVTELSPGNASAYRNLGGVYYYLGKENEALDAFEKSVEIQPNYGVYSNMATVNFYSGNYEEAAKFYEKALELNSTDYQVWSFLSIAYKNSDPPKIEESKSALTKAIELGVKQLEINQRDPELMLNLASFHLELDEPGEAEKLLNRALKLNPSELNNLTKIGRIYERLGNRSEALNWIEKALQNGYAIEDLLDDPDTSYDSIRKDPNFLKMVEKFKGN